MSYDVQQLAYSACAATAVRSAETVGLRKDDCSPCLGTKTTLPSEVVIRRTPLASTSADSYVSNCSVRAPAERTCCAERTAGSAISDSTTIQPGSNFIVELAT